LIMLGESMIERFWGHDCLRPKAACQNDSADGRFRLVAVFDFGQAKGCSRPKAVGCQIGSVVGAYIKKNTGAHHYHDYTALRTRQSLRRIPVDFGQKTEVQAR
jgi:hypothetical protein